jgi:clan AA aspartic protease (TIGR02281 family)
MQVASSLSPEAQAARKVAERAAVAEAEARAEADRLLTGLRAQPCSRQAAIDTLEGLLKARRTDVVLAEAARFEKDCGRWPRLWWLTYAAFEQRGEFSAAAAEATKLIDDAPDDRDYWWWRARAHYNQGAWDKAEADYRRVREICPTCLVGWATADTLEKLERPCEAIGPLVQSLVMHPDLGNADEVRRRIDRLRALPACAAVEGKGSLRLPLAAGHGYTRGSVNGGAVEFIVDTGATTVAVSETMARAMKLDGLPAMAVHTQTANGVVAARQVIADRVEAGPLFAEDVPVVILPDLQGPALLGMSFLGRFNVTIGAKSLVIEGRPTKASP